MSNSNRNKALSTINLADFEHQESEPSKAPLNLFDVDIWKGPMSEAVSWVVLQTTNKPQSSQLSQTKIGFVNANNLNISYSSRTLTEHYRKCDRVFADGSGVMLASRLTENSHSRLKHNINGTDMFPFLCDALEISGGSIYLLGADKGVAEQVAKNIKITNPKLEVAGFHDGYFSDDLSCRRAIKSINRSNPSILLVAMGTPMQEFWLDKYSNSLKVPVVMSVGGLFDFFANKVSRAPSLLRKMGLEWTWRLANEPKRMWRRYILGNPLFLFRVLKESFANKKSLHRTNISSTTQRLLKRSLDLVSACLGLILLSPLLLMIATAIMIESPGSPLYTQLRVGKNGKLFKFWKFRSMVTNAHQLRKTNDYKNDSAGGVLFKLRNDPRVTRIGHYLRRYSLDELPQLWNVVSGEMSLVGPRPALPEEVARYSEEDKARLKVLPGITCYWQVSGRSDLSFNQQIMLDKQYIDTCSFWTDIKILLRTLPAVLSGKGAY
ncbi:MAG: WecB/TagA/CpsF family glycosyltransferase [Kangiellaceae bacterium]|nr:WecB/TagA/CpsF family glycosyltransferase [Kangiellaceae bacterium]